MKRVLIKISGEALTGDGNSIYSFDRAKKICSAIKNVMEAGTDITLVVGGGNIIRGSDTKEKSALRREAADAIGMLSTAMNSIILRELLTDLGLEIVIVSSLNMPFDFEKNDIFTVTRLVSAKKNIIFSCGTGLPYFSTDTLSVVAAAMTKCEVILKATKTDGIYNKDPQKNDNAIYIPEMTYKEAVLHDIKIMDKQAFSLAEQRNIPIRIFDMNEPNCFLRSIRNEIKQSIVSHNRNSLD
jgi:uridylate kinase